MDIVDLASATIAGLLEQLRLTHDRAVLLIDEPEAHKHLILQRSIYGEQPVRGFARSQQLIATRPRSSIPWIRVSCGFCTALCVC